MDFFGHKHFQDKLVDLEVWPSDFWELLLRTQNLKTPLSIFLIRINGGGWRLEAGGWSQAWNQHVKHMLKGTLLYPEVWRQLRETLVIFCP